MNDKRRKGINSLIERLEAIKSNSFFAELEQLKEELEVYRQEEEDAYESMSDRFPEGEKTEKLEASKDHLEDAYSTIESMGEDITSNIDEIINSLAHSVE